MKYLLLNTFPVTGSKNSGDDLITKSLKKLLREVKGNEIQIVEVNPYNRGIESLSNFSKFRAVLLPAYRPLVSKNNSKLLTNRIKYMEKAYNKNIPIFIIGAGWKVYPGTESQSNKIKLDKKEETRLLKYFNKDKNKISCRDIFTENLLRENKIPCYGTTGDCALFDVNYLHKPLLTSQKIEKIAVSLPHNKYYWKRTLKLAEKIKNKFYCDVYITNHGYHETQKERLQNIINKCEEKSIEYVDLSGGAYKLKFYNNIDIHVGFRLYGHIYFLKNRKPSLLIAEDGRGIGHLKTVKGLGVSANPKIVLLLSRIFPNIINNKGGKFKRLPFNVKSVINLLTKEIQQGYPRTKITFNKIDSLWKERMQPFLNMIP
ncbi:MAG: polysaccharide pyruvyl transferase family protein [Atribacterota bacterium]